MKKKLLILCLAILMSLSVVVIYAQQSDNYNYTESNYSITVKCNRCPYKYDWNGPAASASEARSAALTAAQTAHSHHKDSLYASN